MPVLERIDWRAAFQNGLWQLAVVEADVAEKRLFEVLAAAETVALEHVPDPSVEPLDHAVGLRPHRWGQAMFDPEPGAEAVELMIAGRGAAAKAEEPVGELLAIVRQHAGDPHRGGALQIAQEPAGVGRSLRRMDTHEDPAGGAVDRDEQIPALLLIGHLRQVFHVDVDVAGLVCLERLVRGLRHLRLQVTEGADPMPTQASIQPGARDVRVEKLADHGEQVVERQQQTLSQRDRHGLLRRCQRGLQPVRRVAPVVDGIALAPLSDGLLRDAVALGHDPRGLFARLDCGPDLRRRRRLLVQRNQHVLPPSRISRKIDLAMNRPERRGSI